METKTFVVESGEMLNNILRHSNVNLELKVNQNVLSELNKENLKNFSNIISDTDNDGYVNISCIKAAGMGHTLTNIEENVVVNERTLGDEIIDVLNNDDYNAESFYFSINKFGKVSDRIASALDSGENVDVARQVMIYLVDHKYAHRMGSILLAKVYSKNWIGA